MSGTFLEACRPQNNEYLCSQDQSQPHIGDEIYTLSRTRRNVLSLSWWLDHFGPDLTSYIENIQILIYFWNNYVIILKLKFTYRVWLLQCVIMNNTTYPHQNA